MADPERIAARLQSLWEIAHGPAGGADRPAYSPAEAEAMRRVAGWAATLGLTAALDAHGNLWALPAGDGPVLTSGSHVDTVPDGGRYDGALGTVLALELVADLHAAGETRAGLLVCAAEEAPRFGAGTVGSRLLTGALSAAQLADLHDTDGVSAAAALRAFLAELSELPRLSAAPLARIAAHAEVHVALRFGPARIGVVERVAAPRRLEIVVDGDSGHAGEVAMDERRDALAAAAEMVLAVEAAARREPLQTVATVGTLQVLPGAVSVIPGRARLGVDMRGIDATSLDRLHGAVVDAVVRIAAARGLRATTTLIRDGSPMALDATLIATALQVAEEHGIEAAPTWSGAGHDAQHIGSVAPALLLFVPLHDGPSHTPREGAEMAEILQAAEIVTGTSLLYLAKM